MESEAIRIRSFAVSLATAVACTTPALGDSWHIESVDMLPGFLFWQVPMSLALDDQDEPHISFIREGSLVHAYRKSDLWVTEFVAGAIENPDNTITESSGNSRTAVTFSASSCYMTAAQGRTQIAFMGSNPPGLRYAVKSNGSWVTQMVDGRGSSGTEGVSMALDSYGNPHIAYGAYPSYYSSVGLKYASLAADVWQADTVDSTRTGRGRTGGTRSALVIYENTPHIVTSTNRVFQYILRYVSRDPDWFIETITEEGGEVVSMGVDSKGVPHVAWAGDSVLCHAWRVGAGDWTVEKFNEPAEPVWSQIAMAIDANDRVHIVHLDDGRVRYFVRRGIGDWEAETVGEAPSTYRLSLALDKKGRPHIAYLGHDELFPRNLFIRYAYRE